MATKFSDLMFAINNLSFDGAKVALARLADKHYEDVADILGTSGKPSTYAPPGFVAIPVDGGFGAEKFVSQSHYDAIMNMMRGNRKVEAIKELRYISRLGLKDAKDAVEIWYERLAG